MKKTIWFAIALTAMNYCVYTQEATTLDQALQAANRYLEGRLQPGSKVVILNFQTEYVDLSNYIIDELTTYVVNGGVITVVDRQNLEIIRQEMHFQTSGEVSDESAQAIGRMLGAQSIISGTVQRLGTVYRLRVRAISVESAAIQGMQNYNVKMDAMLAALMNMEHAETASAAPLPASTPTPEKTVPIAAPKREKQPVVARDEWKNKRWYLGVLTGYGTGFNFLATTDVFFTKNFGLGVELGWQGFVYVESTSNYDYVSGSYTTTYGYDSTKSMFVVDLLAKLLFRPGKCELGIYIGPIIGAGLAVTLGGEFGFNVGPGILFLDIRGSTLITSVSEVRGSSSINIGYKIGLGNR